MRLYAPAAPPSLSRSAAVPGRQTAQRVPAEAWSQPAVASRGTSTVYSTATSSYPKKDFSFHDPKSAKQGLNTATIAAASYFPGDHVEARWGAGDTWFPATITANCGDSTFIIDWQDGNSHGRTKRLEDLRRSGTTTPARPMTAKPVSTTMHSVGKTPVEPASHVPAANTAAAAGASCSQASPSPSSPSSRQPPRAAKASCVRTASVPSQAATLPPEWLRPAAERLGAEQLVVDRHAVEQPVAGQPTAEATNAFDVSDDAAANQQTEGIPPLSVPTTQPAAVLSSASGEEEPEVRKARSDVKCFMVELADGETCVVVQRADGKRWRFERNSIEFELACDAEALQTWLGGISDQQMPGLLTLIADEVNSRGARLKAAEKERDALRGTEDYEFFGLDGNACSDKDVEKAYRKMSTVLHPDKGGDEQSFNAMRERYDQIKALRGESKRQGGGGGAIRWDPNCRDSMLTAHSDLREQLIWITKLIGDVEKETEERRRRQLTQQALAWDGPPSPAYRLVEADPPGITSA